MIKDKVLHQSINKLGFTKISLGNKELTNALGKIYQSYFQQKKNSDDMAVTHNNPNDNRAIKIHQKIIETVKPYFDECFEEYAFLASHFVVKKAQSNEAFQIHQDWNVVDETKYQNYQVWIPLDLSYPENGGICFIPESHLFFNNIRSGNLGIPHIPIEKKLHPYLSYLRLFPGEAAIFFSKTFHGSFINSTPNDRIAVLINIIQKKSTPLYFHYSEKKRQVEAYSLSTSEIFQFLPQLEKGKIPFDKKPNFVTSNNTVENLSIKADDLIKKIHLFNHKEGRAKDYEHKLYHIIKDSEIEKEINNKGYKVVQLLDKEALESLKHKFEEVFPDRTKFTGTYSTMSDVSETVRKETHEFTFQTVKRCLNKYFKDYQSPISLLYSRRPDNQYYLEWHSDPSLIFNQHLEPLYGIWCPLVDTDKIHGGLKVVPGSHRLLDKIICAYKTFKWPLENKRTLLENYSKDFKLKAGEAILFDARIIHSSEPNKSNIERDNFVMRVNHEKSEYFNIMTKSINDSKGKLFKQNRNYFFTKTIKEHNTTPNTGEYIGDMYLFYNEINDSSIKEKLDIFN